MTSCSLNLNNLKDPNFCWSTFTLCMAAWYQVIFEGIGLNTTLKIPKALQALLLFKLKQNSYPFFSSGWINTKLLTISLLLLSCNTFTLQFSHCQSKAIWKCLFYWMNSQMEPWLLPGNSINEIASCYRSCKRLSSVVLKI